MIRARHPWGPSKGCGWIELCPLSRFGLNLDRCFAAYRFARTRKPIRGVSGERRNALNVQLLDELGVFLNILEAQLGFLAHQLLDQ